MSFACYSPLRNVVPAKQKDSLSGSHHVSLSIWESDYHRIGYVSNRLRSIGPLLLTQRADGAILILLVGSVVFWPTTVNVIILMSQTGNKNCRKILIKRQLPEKKNSYKILNS